MPSSVYHGPSPIPCIVPECSWFHYLKSDRSPCKCPLLSPRPIAHAFHAYGCSSAARRSSPQERGPARKEGGYVVLRRPPKCDSPSPPTCDSPSHPKCDSPRGSGVAGWGVMSSSGCQRTPFGFPSVSTCATPAVTDRSIGPVPLRNQRLLAS